ncbi:MAG: hypothetical protein VX210_08945 [Myxococcota bacterium]|nr:hypothetical protein [Myxococcota bacterium]
MTNHVTRHLVRGMFLSAFVSGTLACGAEEVSIEPLELPEGCQPLLAGLECGLPFPSDHFLVDDPTMPSGKRIAMQASAIPTNHKGELADVFQWREADGFSVVPPIVAWLGEDVAPGQVVNIRGDHSQSVRPENTTVIINTSTGELVPHFVDQDPRATEGRQSLIIRPLAPLELTTRYVVAMQGLKGLDGEVIEAPEGFRRLKARQSLGTTDGAQVELRYQNEIFPELRRAGLKVDELQLAWDFTTGSAEWQTRDVLDAHNAAAAVNAIDPPVIEIVGTDSTDDDRMAHLVHGTIRVPSVLDGEGPGSPLLRNEEGRVITSGFATYPFVVVIPKSALERDDAAPVLHFGHGFFGKRSEALGGAVRNIAHESKSVVFAVDWIGMAEDDIGLLCEAVSRHLWRTLAATDRIPQAMVNWSTLTTALDSAFDDEPLFQHPERGGLIFNPEEVNFLGISMGSIFGTVFSAIEPRVERTILHVGGGSFGHMMSRAAPFAPILFMFDISMEDTLHQQLFSSILQTHFDRIDPGFFVRFLNQEALPGREKSDRKVMIQMAVADTSVPNFATLLQARGAGTPLLESDFDSPYGFQTISEVSAADSAFVIYDTGLDGSFELDPQPQLEKTPIHDSLRNRSEVVQQMVDFYDDNIMQHPCFEGCGGSTAP